MRFIFSGVLICLLSISASATNYYFSSLSGDDTRSASQAQNASTPWKSLNKLNSFFSSLQAGDAVLFKRGETFYGSISISKSGSSGAPIVLGAYGSGSKPIITTLVTLSGWTANSSYSGVFESSSNSSMGSEVSILLLNNVQKAIGRYPNPTEPNGGYLTIESHSGVTSLTDEELPSSPNWTGADAVIRTNHWTIDRTRITSHSGKTLTYKATPSAARDKYGYFIQNSIKTLDVLGEWYYNPSTKKISVFFGMAGPSGYTVKAATQDNIIYSSNISNVTIDNLELKGSNKDGVSINGGTNMVVQNCDISFSGSDGVFGSGSKFKIENCTVLNSNNDGVDVSKGSNAIVRNNIITNSYTMPGMGQGGNGQGSGIRNCSGGLVEYNQVINTGYIGIEMGGDNSIIKNNLIDNVGFIKDDGGGIYTSNGLNGTNSGRIITGNIILNGVGAPDGTDSRKSSMQGIYLDDNANGVEITDNTIVNCNLGTYLHNSRSVIVRNNTFYNNNTSQLYMKHDALGDPLKNHTITNNIFFSHTLTQLTASISSIANDLGNLGAVDNNYYARPIDDGTSIYSGYTNSSGTKVSGIYDLEAWRSIYGFDKFSKGSSKQIKPYTITGTIGSNKFADGLFGSIANTLKVWANSCTLSFNNSGLLDGGYLKVVPTATGSSIVVNVGGLSSSKKYILKYSVKGAGNLSIAANLRASSYQPLTDLKYWSVTTSRSDNETLFTPSMDESNGSLVFTIDAKQTYYIDNIQLYEAIATPTNPDDSIKFVYNASKSNKTINLNGNYVDVKNKSYSGSIVLNPYTSAVLIKDGGVTTNVAPTVNITSPTVSSNYSDPATVQLTAEAADSDGTISKVEFYNGSTLIITENTFPYDWTWGNVPPGNYNLTAKATDNSGNVTTSPAVSFSVSASSTGPAATKPKVVVTSPVVNDIYDGPATVRLTALASVVDGTISTVAFYNGSTLLKIEDTFPFDWKWSNVPAGNYSITAKATDNNGNVTTSPAVSFSVLGSGSTLVTITSPVLNAVYTGTTNVRLTALASAENSTIKKVEFYNGDILVGTEKNPPYDRSWNNVGVGTYILTAKATDNNGNTTTSAPVAFKIVDQPLTVAAPQNNTYTIDEDADSSLATAKPDLLVHNEFKLYPNPATDVLNVVYPYNFHPNEKATVSVVNASGSLVKRLPVVLSGSIQVDISSLKPGVYILNLSNENFKIAKKFIKVNR